MRETVVLERIATGLEEANRLQRERNLLQRREQDRAATERYVQRATQKDLRGVGVGFLAHGVPVIAEALSRKIPDEFWILVENEEVDVACPCKETARVAYDRLTTCRCGRTYLYDGDAVRVANSPK